MQHYKTHITSKITTILLVVALVTPSFVKLSHVFANHEHEVCTATFAQHVHEINIDCEFYKFKKTGESYVNHNYNGLEPILNIQKKITLYYTYLSSHQQLSVSLRGPPLT